MRFRTEQETASGDRLDGDRRRRGWGWGGEEVSKEEGCVPSELATGVFQSRPCFRSSALLLPTSTTWKGQLGLPQGCENTSLERAVLGRKSSLWVSVMFSLCV